MSKEKGPAIGDIVHYVAYGTPGGEFPKTCRAAIITEVKDQWVVGLAVYNPSGMFFHPAGIDEDEDPQGGTWHWPEVTE